MKIRLKEKFKTLVHGIVMGYRDPEQGNIVRLGHIHPGQVKDIPDPQAKELLLQNKCFEEVSKKETGKENPK